MAPSRVYVLGCVMLYCCMLAYDAIIFEHLNMGLDLYTTFQLEGWKMHSKKEYHLNRSLLVEKGIVFSESRSKVILIWRPFFGVAIDNQEACPGCILTHDHSAAGTADALVFHCADLSDSKSYLPTNLRSTWQRYVWLCMEPPGNVRFTFQKVLTEMDNVFNWTMTYRTDSDILMSYATLWDPVNKTIAELIKEKDASELVVWAVSNCHAKLRIEYANELAKYVPVDYYGNCYAKKGGLNIRRYKFYLAFENSHCKDYITEKFWSQALSNFAVPVVMGTTRSDYERVAPPNSFIHVDDFESPRELASYLLKLDNDDKLYGEYLRWRSLPDNNGMDWKSDVTVNSKLKDPTYKRMINTVKNTPHTMCRLCEKLKNEPPKDKVDVVSKLDQWWYGSGYTSSSNEFPICSKYSGPTGLVMRPYVTLIYTVMFILISGILFWCLFYKKRHAKDLSF